MYNTDMTEKDVIEHWRNSARNELKSAKLLRDGGQYPGALFHCHLAVEKALKARFMEQHRKEAPYTHNLLQLSKQLDIEWTGEQKNILADLSQFATLARYDDSAWAEQEATMENISRWIKNAEMLLSILIS